MSNSRTIYDKIWDDHLVNTNDDGTSLIYIDRHLVHEVTSPQAFEGLRMTKRKVRCPEKTLAVVDHNVPTTDRKNGIEDDESRIQVEALEKNCKEFGVEYCNITRCCTEVCPAGIQITDDAIIQLKERVIDRYYDPIAKIWRAIKGQKVRK